MGHRHSKKPGKKKHAPQNEYKGVLEVTRSGMGFVVVENLETDVLVRPNDFNTALHGDVVRVKVNPQREGKRLQGVISAIVERKQSEFIGRLQMNKGFAFFVADADKKIPDIYIPERNFNEATEGDRVVVRITEWEQGTGKRPMGEVVNIETRFNSTMLECVIKDDHFSVRFIMQ